MATFSLNQMTLIGVGLIGGSFALDLKRKGLVRRVVGVDVNVQNLERALERKVIDEAATEIDSASIAGSDLVLIATPVATLPAICTRLAPLLQKETIVSDVGSTKQSALQAFAQYLPDHLPNCVAAHPIAGSDRHGALAAQFGLYEGKKLILCPNPVQNPAALDLLEKLWREVGTCTFIMPAAEHDAIFAAVSHMPHLLAFSYVHQIQDHADADLYLNFAASGFRDFTRIASSHPAIWTDICLANRQSLLDLIEGQRAQLDKVAYLLQAGDAEGLYAYLEEAKATRDGWLEQQN
ncbi:MAG: prephenate dehydrogenase [Neisseria sp.]|uniref:prephenate dehydrogenase n=1 Tax=Neisseria sp. TaxID=192066 RepID=UPI0026DBFD9D|nr:prephenate dehydrogenase [Neisseria sp.]MDO4641492.1 prephenate dehydrogenase [Neisseria sp.]